MSRATGALTAAAFGRSLKAEALKAAGLPGVWLGAALALALPVVVEYINDRNMSSKASAQGAGAPGGLSDAGIASIVFGTTGIVVLAACVMVSEYTCGPRTSGASRQVATTMLVAPRRGACVAAKLVVVVGAATALLALTTAVTFAVARHELCSWAPFSPIPWHRLAGLLAWWLFSATASMALAVATRSALVSMTALIAMSTAIAPGALLIRSADAARFLPDAAMARLVGGPETLSYDRLTALLSVPAASAICAAWVIGCMAACCWVWMRRDA